MYCTCEVSKTTSLASLPSDTSDDLAARNRCSLDTTLFEMNTGAVANREEGRSHVWHFHMLLNLT